VRERGGRENERAKREYISERLSAATFFDNHLGQVSLDDIKIRIEIDE